MDRGGTVKARGTTDTIVARGHVVKDDRDALLRLGLALQLSPAHGEPCHPAELRLQRGEVREALTIKLTRGYGIGVDLPVQLGVADIGDQPYGVETIHTAVVLLGAVARRIGLQDGQCQLLHDARTAVLGLSVDRPTLLEDPQRIGHEVDDAVWQDLALGAEVAIQRVADAPLARHGILRSRGEERVGLASEAAQRCQQRIHMPQVVRAVEVEGDDDPDDAAASPPCLA